MFCGYGYMPVRFFWTVVLVGLFALCQPGYPAGGDDEKEWAPAGEPPPAASSIHTSEHSRAAAASLSIEAVVVNPYRSANVGSQVGGVFEHFHFEEGDLIEEGQVVVELAPKRYQLMVRRADERLKALEVALKRAEQEAQLKEELFGLNGTTRQEVIKAKAEAEIAGYRVAEAKADLDLALFELDACKIKAPFTGHLAARHKQPDETVDRNEKVFTIVDSSQVHAVANVPEGILSEFKKGTRARFVYGADKKFSGTVDRIGKIIDPKSRTKRVYLLIENSGNELEVGMTGSLQLVK
jgi:RND family efflux transporter MFP subunit